MSDAVWMRKKLAEIDDEIVAEVLGPAIAGKAACFEDQYLSTGGQLYELMAGHDRFIADIRPVLMPVLAARGLPRPLACHPYDLCSCLIAAELGVRLTDAAGGEGSRARSPASGLALEWLTYASTRPLAGSIATSAAYGTS